MTPIIEAIFLINERVVMDKLFIRTSFVLAIVLFLNSVNLQGYDKARLIKKINKNLMHFWEQEKLRLPENFESHIPDIIDSKNSKDIISDKGENPMSEKDHPESEITVAMNPTDNTNIIVSPIYNGAGGMFCPVYYSRDGGNSWDRSSFTNNSNFPGTYNAGGGDPVLAFDADGTAYMSWIKLFVTLRIDDMGQQEPDSVFVILNWAKSTDGGENWIRPENDELPNSKCGTLYDPEGISFDRFTDKQWMVCDQSDSEYRNNLYLSATTITMDSSSEDPYVAIELFTKEASNDFFNENSSEPSSQNDLSFQFSMPEVDKFGNLHVTFLSIGDKGVAFYHTVSTDGGHSFSTPVKISDIHGTNPNAGETESVEGLERLYPCPQFAIDKSSGDNSGNLYFSWTANGFTSDLGKGLNVYFSRSTDNGETWSEAEVIHDDDKSMKIHNFYPSLAVTPDGVVAIAWYDQRANPETGETEYWMTYSFDGGNSFIDNFRISGGSSIWNKTDDMNNGFGIGEYNQMVCTDEYAMPFWADGRTNDGNLNIYMAKIPVSTTPLGVESVTSINGDIFIENISPNPAKDNINIQIKCRDHGIANIEIYDYSGKQYISTQCMFNNDHNMIDIDVSDLPGGSYIVVVKSKESICSEMISVE